MRAAEGRGTLSNVERERVKVVGRRSCTTSMAAMELLADRFVVVDDGRAVDLATGDLVLLTIESAGGPSDELRWVARCDFFRRVRHPALAPLVDYGAVGESQRFEAWCGCSPWAGAAAEAEAIGRAASSFLHACGLTDGSDRALTVQDVDGRPVVRPSADAGYPCSPGAGDASPLFPLENCGILRIERPAVSAIAELFDEPSGGEDRRPQVVGIWGPEGSGKTTAVLDLARVARLKGHVPLAVRLLNSPLAEAIVGRSVFLIDDDDCGGISASTVPAAIDLTRGSWTPRSDLRDVTYSCVRPAKTFKASLAPGWIACRRRRFVAAILPAAAGADRRVRRAAEGARGLPGRFVRLIDESRYARGRPRASAVLRAAERAPMYGVYGADSGPAVEGVASSAWPVLSDLGDLRRRMEIARTASSGRETRARRAGRAPGDRRAGASRRLGERRARGRWPSAPRCSGGDACATRKRRSTPRASIAAEVRMTKRW